MKKQPPNWLSLIFIVFGILFIYIIDWGFLSGSITEYPIMCPSDFHEKNGCYTLNTTTYYPNKNNQTVKMKTDFNIETLSKCSVINRTNWECKFNDESASFGFINSQFHSVTLTTSVSQDLVDKYERETSYVGRIRYLLEYWHLI